MKHWIAAVAALATIMGTRAAQSQDWDYGESRESGRVAMVRYDEGTSIVVQCLRDELKVLITGLPQTAGVWRGYDASRADGRTDVQIWHAGETRGAVHSRVVGRDARFLRGGGSYELRARPTEGLPPISAVFDLPTEWANLDRVLTGCGRPLEAPRDALARIEGQSNAPTSGPSLAARPTGLAGDADFYAEVSCIIQAQTFSACQAEGVRPVARRRDARQFLRSVERQDLSATAPLEDGRVAYVIFVAGQLEP